MKELTAIVLAAKEAPLTIAEPINIAGVRHLIRQSENPELAAAYDRIDELTSLLERARDAMMTDCFNGPALHECVVAIQDTLDPWSLQ